MEFNRKEIKKWLAEDEKLIAETKKKIDEYLKYPKKMYGDFENLLYEYGKYQGHKYALEAILKLHS